MTSSFEERGTDVGSQYPTSNGR